MRHTRRQWLKTAAGIFVPTVCWGQFAPPAMVGKAAARQTVAAGGGLGLLTNLTSVWEMEQADASDAPDATASGLTLTRSGTRSQFATPKIQGSYSNKGSGYLYSADSAFQGTGSFSVISWIYNAAGYDGMTFFGRWGLSNNIWLVWGSSSTTVQFAIRKADNSGNRTATSTINPGASWNLLTATYNSSTKKGYIRINSETAVELDTAGDGLRDLSESFQVGNSGSGVNIDETAFWAGRVLSSTDIDNIYASGSGLFYPSWT